MKSVLIAVVLGALSIAATGCGDCAGVGLTEIRPGIEQTISVGATLTLEYWDGGSCGSDESRHLDRQDVRWWTIDTLVIRVDSVSGVVQAVGRGDALVWIGWPGMAVGPSIHLGEVFVHVR